MGPKPGYWREDAASIEFYKCFNSAACLGSSLENYDPSGTCHSSYHGILCAEC